MLVGCVAIHRGIRSETGHGAVFASAELRTFGAMDSSLFFELMEAEPGAAVDEIDAAGILRDELGDDRVGIAHVVKWAVAGLTTSTGEVVLLRGLILGGHLWCLRIDVVGFVETVLALEADAAREDERDVHDAGFSVG